MARRDAASPPEDLIEQYLLGRLPDRERASAESLLFENESFYEAVRDAEDALIDRYLAGELAAADREAFERHFAASPTRRERIAFARALTRAEGAPRRPRSPRATWTALAATLFLGALWLAEQNAGPSRPSPSPAPAHSPTGALTPPPEVTPAPLRLRLQAEVLRSAGAWPRVDLPVAAPTVQLVAELERAPAHGTYSGSLRLVGGGSVWRGPAVVDAALGTIHVDVPAHLLQAGDYALSFEPRRALPDEYFFRARRSSGTQPD
jgi:anti-sigma factor RsiW